MVSRAGSQALGAVEASLSRQLIDDMLTTYYVPLELWYVQTIVDKVMSAQRLLGSLLTWYQAHRLSSPDITQSPVVTTTPDDVFYILKVVLSRLISTGSVTAVEQMVGKLQEVMERNYVGIIKRKLDEAYRHGAAPSASAREKADRESRQSFIVRKAVTNTVQNLKELRCCADFAERFRCLFFSHGTFGQRALLL